MGWQPQVRFVSFLSWWWVDVGSTLYAMGAQRDMKDASKRDYLMSKGTEAAIIAGRDPR